MFVKVLNTPVSTHYKVFKMVSILCFANCEFAAKNLFGGRKESSWLSDNLGITQKDVPWKKNGT